MPINGARGRGGGGAHPWHAPTTRRLVAGCPGLLWEVLPGALGGQVGRIPSAPTTQGGGGNPQKPPGNPPGAHPNSTGHRFWQLRRRVPVWPLLSTLFHSSTHNPSCSHPGLWSQLENSGQSHFVGLIFLCGRCASRKQKNDKRVARRGAVVFRKVNLFREHDLESGMVRARD